MPHCDGGFEEDSLAVIAVLQYFVGWHFVIFRTRKDLSLESLAFRQQCLALYGKRLCDYWGPLTSSSVVRRREEFVQDEKSPACWQTWSYWQTALNYGE